MTEKATVLGKYRVGRWLASDQAFLDGWLSQLILKVEREKKPLHPVIRDFKELIEHDSEIYMLFHQMFTQVPFGRDPLGRPQVRSYRQMLRLFNEIMTRAPEFSVHANKVGLVGFPINTILDWSMATPGGFAAFLNDRVNAMFQTMLNEWAIFLKSKDSRYVLNKKPRTGWLGKAAQEAMGISIAKVFQCDPRKPHYGFASWDDFFTREFRRGQRPVARPRDDSIVVNACESAPYRLAHDVKRRNRFWIKAQPYSLAHMLDNDPYTSRFLGGTVYQAFLSALSYHRWHSPVSGTIVKAYVVDGTYYSEAMSEGFDPSGPNESQGYITAVATRALIFIEADNPDIGLMCVMPVGMSEVSNCEITVYEGQHVMKGEQLGMFHFGGSTHCLFFGPKVRIDFDLHGQKPGLNSENIPINSKIAKVRRKRR